MPRPYKPKTNVEFITDLMEFSRNGALMQCFIIEAVANYSARVKDATLPDLGPVNPAAWKRCAEEALAEIESKYGAPTPAD